MKNKMAVLSTLGLAMLIGVSMVYASDRGAKANVTFTVTTPQIISKQPASVYSIILGTGAVTDYVVLFDSANATAQAVSNIGIASFRGKFYASSATQNTQITFDPPLQFTNGITAIAATSLVPTTVTYEVGRVVRDH